MSRKILALEDSEDFRNLLRMTLEFKGYEVTLANHGNMGLEAARQQTFDLILSDIDMPEMNGVEFVRQYRKEFGGDTPIIMLSAEGDDVMNQALAAGATGSINKPFEPIQLLQVVEQHLN